MTTPLTLEPQFNKEKYLHILKSTGYDAALTALHRDMESWEYQVFEGKAGYQPGLWKDVESIRQFSRNLWDLALKSA